MENENICFTEPRLRLNLKNLKTTKEYPLRGLHLHNAIEVVRIFFGELICRIDDEEIILSDGDIILINKRTAHSLSCVSDEASFIYIQIDMDNYTKEQSSNKDKFFYEFIYGKEVLKYKKFEADNELGGILEKIERELKEKRLGYEHFIKSHIFYISAVMLRENLLPHVKESEKRKSILKILPGVHYTESNFASNVNLDDVSIAASTDKFYFCKLFKKISGATFTDYLNFVRLGNAEHMLLTTDKNISEISFECGFSSIQYFNRRFKAKNGCSPKEYRKLNSV